MKRDINIDCLKGILIILVVIGHVLSSANLKFVNYIYLFHMPAFIVLSGMCYRNFNFKKTILRTFIPFLVYMMLIYFYSNRFLYNTPLENLLFGGSKLGGVFGVFWFIPCLFYAKTLFALIDNLKIKKLYKIFVIAILYIANILLIRYLTYEKIIFWNMDIAFICLTYYAIGYFLKDKKYDIKLQIISLIIVMVISLLWNFDILKITFNMKIKSLFYNPIIQIIFPIAITLVTLKIVSYIRDNNIIKRLLSYIGKSSIVIMYLHVIIFNTIDKYTNITYMGQIIISIMIPVLIYWLFGKNKYLRKLFIG